MHANSQILLASLLHGITEKKFESQLQQHSEDPITMGNTESVSKEFTSAELQATLKRDNVLCSITEDNLLSDEFVGKKYLQELEGSTTKYKEENDELTKQKKREDRGKNL